MTEPTSDDAPTSAAADIAGDNAGDNPAAGDNAAGGDVEQRWQALRGQPKFSRVAPSTLRAAWWAGRALHRARRDLKSVGLQTHVAPPPALPWGSRLGVDGILRRTDPTCLERCLVMQAWLLAHGVAHDVLIGVDSRKGEGVKAHAWLEWITSPDEHAGYAVIHRLPAR